MKKKENFHLLYIDLDIHTTIYLPLLHCSIETKGRVNDAIFTFLFSYSFFPLSLSFHTTGQLKEWQKKKSTTKKSSTSVVTSRRQFNLCACVYKRKETMLLLLHSHPQIQSRK